MRCAGARVLRSNDVMVVGTRLLLKRKNTKITERWNNTCMCRLVPRRFRQEIDLRFMESFARTPAAAAINTAS